MRDPERNDLREAIEEACRAAGKARELLERMGSQPAPIEPEAAKLKGSSEPARLLTPREVAGRLGVTLRWVYAHAGRWTFTRRLGHRTLRFEPAGFEKFLL